MSSPARPERRPSIARRHPARAAAEAAQQAEASAKEPAGNADEQLAETRENGLDGAAASSAKRPAADRRLSSGRVSYAGKAVTIYFPSTEDKDRAQAAFAARGGMEGYTSASEWMADVILERTEQWERDYNGGRPFTDVLARRRARRRR